MAEFVEDLAKFIEDEGHGTRAATSGWAILHEGLDESPDTMIAVRTTAGEPSEGQFGSDSLLYETPHAAIWTRAGREDQDAARTKAFAVYKSLGKIQAEDVNGTNHWMVVCLQSPFFLKFDEQKRPIFVFNVRDFKAVSA